MATKYLTPNTSDLSATGNWSGGSLPSAGDDVIVTDGVWTLDSGLNALAAIELDSFTIGAGVTLDCTAAIQLDLSGSGGAGLVDESRGTVRIQAVDAGGAGDGGIPNAVISRTQRSGAVYLTGNGGQNDGSNDRGWDKVSVLQQSRVYVGSDAYPQNLIVDDTAFCKLDSAGSAFKPATVNVAGRASLTSDRLIDAGEFHTSGVVFMDGAGIEDLVLRLSPGGSLLGAGSGASLGSGTSELYTGMVAARASDRGETGTPSLGASNTRGSKNSLRVMSRSAGFDMTIGTLTAQAGESIVAQETQSTFGPTGSN